MLYELFKGTKIVDLGTGNNINVSNIPGYKSFTVDNFIIEPIRGGQTSVTPASTGGNLFCYADVSKSYNATTGIFTRSVQARAAYFTSYPSVAFTVRTYLVY
jgi:hypothetical protein